MGLDMYLSAEKYVGGYEFSKERPQYEALVQQHGVRAFVTDESPSATVSFTVGYWRKANQIHKWFVDTCQDGTDDCRSAYVGRERLTELRDLCNTVLSDPVQADELLPPQEGFFFGSTDTDEWYMQDLKHTVEVIDRVLKMPETWDFYYRSSW